MLFILVSIVLIVVAYIFVEKTTRDRTLALLVSGIIAVGLLVGFLL